MNASKVEELLGRLQAMYTEVSQDALQNRTSIIWEHSGDIETDVQRAEGSTAGQEALFTSLLSELETEFTSCEDTILDFREREEWYS